MDMPYENTRSSGNIGIINYSKYASKNSKSKSKNKNKSKKHSRSKSKHHSRSKHEHHKVSTVTRDFMKTVY